MAVNDRRHVPKAPRKLRAVPALDRAIADYDVQAAPGFTCIIAKTTDGRLFQYSFGQKKWLALPPIPSGDVELVS